VAERVDLLIAGAGPAGLSAALRAHEAGLSYLLLERSDHLADTIHCYQKRKHVMAEPAPIPQRGELPFAAGSRESILAAWNEAVKRSGLRVRFGEELQGLARAADGFRVRTSRGEHAARSVVLAIGTQGNPRRLEAPGEELPHVATRLVDPDDYVDRSIVVVGAGDSALEIALALCERNQVYLVVRKAEIVRPKEALFRELLKRQNARQIEVLYSTVVRRVLPGRIELRGAQADLELPVDQVFLKIGTQPPRQLLAGFGVDFISADAEAKPVLSERYESSVPGLFVIGATTGRDLIKPGINQGWEVVEHLLGNDVEPADEEVLRAVLPFWPGTVRQRIVAAMEEIPLLGAVAATDGDAGADERTAAARQAASGEVLRETFLSAQAHRYGDGEVILRQNDYTDSVLAVVSGAVEIRRTAEDGSEARVAVLSAGNFLGEMGLISGRRRNATAVAVGSSELLEVPRKAMLKLLYSAPRVKRLVDETFLLRALQNYLPPQVPVSDLWRLVAKAKVETFERDQVVFREGDAGEAFFLLRSGQVKLAKRSGDREVIVTYLVAGNFFGEGALVGAEPRSVTVTTIFPCELVRIDRADFAAFAAQFPGLRPQLEARIEALRAATLREEATPGAGRVLGDLIREEVVMGTDTLLIDEHLCVRCNNCIRACEDVHEDGQARLSLTGVKFANVLAPNSCWQCANPLCMLDCPPDALYRDARGEIHIKDNCIGCGNCESNCPYGNIFMVHPQAGSSLFGWVKSLFGGEAASDRTVAVKCDLCSSLPGGPACCRSCPTGAAIRVKPEEYQRTVERLIAAGGGH
jgi:CRP-like cAMP-binding protein/thioredoxin reductase